MDDEDNKLLSKENSGIKPRVTDPDEYETNDTFLTAYPYNNVADLTPKLSKMNQLYTLGMKHAGLHSETDEDWFSINLTAGTQYFVDLRNIGRMNWYIELYYVQSHDENGYKGYKGYKYTTDPEQNPIYKDHPEKFFYFTAQDTGTYYIRVTSGNAWEDSMHYFFYVGLLYKRLILIIWKLWVV